MPLPFAFPSLPTFHPFPSGNRNRSTEMDDGKLPFFEKKFKTKYVANGYQKTENKFLFFGRVSESAYRSFWKCFQKLAEVSG
jgi:hypothetical protein